MPAAVVLAAAAALGYWPLKPDRGLALSAADTTGQLYIVWDRMAPPIQRAIRGSLEILDRGVHTEVMLTSGDLRFGSVCYVRQSGDVALRLVVYLPGRAAVEETTHFLKPAEIGTAQAPLIDATAAKKAESSPPADQPTVNQAPVAKTPVAKTPVSPTHARKSRSAKRRSAKSRAAKSRSGR